MSHPYEYDAVRALRDVATHLEEHPDLDPPARVRFDPDHPTLTVEMGVYSAWLNSASFVSDERLISLRGIHDANAAIRLGDSVYQLNSYSVSMTRTEVETLLNWTPTAKAV